MITLAIPSYNRSSCVIGCFEKVISDSRIAEVLIIDDSSDLEIYKSMASGIEKFRGSEFFSKIKIIRNDENLGSFRNKKKCVYESSMDWVVLLDSDNSIDIEYLNSLDGKKDNSTIYTPSHAMCDSPYLNYTKYSGHIVDKTKYKKILTEEREQMWDCILNTGNYFFNKNTYLYCIDKETETLDSFAADAFYLIYLWMKNTQEGKLEVVENMKYNHSLSIDSHWVNNSANSSSFINGLIKEVASWDF
jgi:glycosyltransferase involved in cell wall biosynthesis